jgi:hypothetical protein
MNAYRTVEFIESWSSRCGWSFRYRQDEWSEIQFQLGTEQPWTIGL